jgi:hypothetical protein
MEELQQQGWEMSCAYEHFDPPSAETHTSESVIRTATHGLEMPRVA